MSLTNKKPTKRDTPKAIAWRSKRTPLAKVSKKAKAKRKSRAEMLDWYFGKHSFIDSPEFAFCQCCGLRMERKDADFHHKVLRSRGGTEAMSNGLAVHRACHLLFIHDGILGMPIRRAGMERIQTAMESPANITNGGRVEWQPRQRLDLSAHCARSAAHEG